MTPHVTGLYLTWLRQSPEERRSVDEHLAGCPSCAAYYEKMSLLLTASGEEPRRLAADPYLPDRLLARSVPGRERRIGRAALRWSMAGALAILAVIIGIRLGTKLAPSAQTAAASSYSTDDIVSAYYGAVSQQSFSTRLETVVPSTEEATQ